MKTFKFNERDAGRPAVIASGRQSPGLDTPAPKKAGGRANFKRGFDDKSIKI